MMGFTEGQTVLRQLRICIVALAVAAFSSLTAFGVGARAQASTNQESVQLNQSQTEAVEVVNRYLNSFMHLEGDFRQVAPDGQISTGRFFIRRPGRARFDYEEPNRLLVIADGFWIGIVDRKLRTTDRYPIGSTPYWALLKDEVDLQTDARILAVEREGNLILISIDDPTGQAAGTLTLIFEESDGSAGHVGDGSLALTHWLVTDAQGLTTSVEVSNLVKGRRARNNMFTLHQYDR